MNPATTWRLAGIEPVLIDVPADEKAQIANIFYAFLITEVAAIRFCYQIASLTRKRLAERNLAPASECGKAEPPVKALVTYYNSNRIPTCFEKGIRTDKH